MNDLKYTMIFMGFMLLCAVSAVLKNDRDQRAFQKSCAQSCLPGPVSPDATQAKSDICACENGAAFVIDG